MAYESKYKLKSKGRADGTMYTCIIWIPRTYQLATFRKPFTEQGMGINLNQLALWVSDLGTIIAKWKKMSCK